MVGDGTAAMTYLLIIRPTYTYYSPAAKGGDFDLADNFSSFLIMYD